MQHVALAAALVWLAGKQCRPLFWLQLSVSRWCHLGGSGVVEVRLKVSWWRGINSGQVWRTTPLTGSLQRCTAAAVDAIGSV
jgi:hypothetical protein